MTEYDCIIIGAGSIGVPTALALGRSNLKTLVLDTLPSVGQGDNKHVIGGIRATHSNNSKIMICLRSIKIFSSWERQFGDDINWVQGGYTFVAYTDDHKRLFQTTVKYQQKHGLKINWVDPEKIKELIPGITEEGLRGGTYSPGDGTASPLLAINSFYRQAENMGVKFRFNENVIDILTKNNTVVGVKTSKGTYRSQWVINAAGAGAKEVAQLCRINIPVIPDSHEAGITEPVQRFFSTMIVDIRPAIDERWGNSKNYYFYQNPEGQIVFCLTPDPPIIGTDRRETSTFLPQIAKRIIQLIPRLRAIRIRRTWRGLYPMTPDGLPIVGPVNDLKGYINAVGMCGQGYMLGPGLGEILERLVNNKTTTQDKEIFENFSLYRDFSRIEQLK